LDVLLDDVAAVEVRAGCDEPGDEVDFRAVLGGYEEDVGRPAYTGRESCDIGALPLPLMPASSWNAEDCQSGFSSHSIDRMVI
jgi:hypothetical protein